MPNFLGALPITMGDMGDGDYLSGPGRRRRHHPGHYGSAMSHAATERANMAARFVRPDLPGAPNRDAALLPAAFPIFSFALATGTNTISQTMNPQTPFRGQRFTAVVIRNGTSAATTAPVISALQVGQKPIIATTGTGVPLEVFNQNAFDTNLLFPPTVPGVIYVASINLVAALTTTDTILCLVSVIGSAVL
jgi:hypothetical protein